MFFFSSLIIPNYTQVLERERKMEATATISIESLSYRWLLNLKSTFENLDDSLEASDEAVFIVMDPKMTPSKRFLGDTQDFNFPISTPSNNNNLTFLHAEELFSNGFLMPLFLTNPSKIESITNTTSNNSTTSSSLPINSKPSKNNLIISINQIHSIFAKKCWKSSKRIFRKYLGFFKLSSVIYHKQSSSKSLVDRNWDDSQKKQIMSSSSSSSPTRRTNYYYCSSTDAEGSIYEAVLHCKKSIGMYL